MRVLWYSNAPFAPSGYGNQTAQICAHLPRLGYELAVASNYGINGARIEVQGVKVYPLGRDRWSNDIVRAYADDWNAEAVVSLFDVWALRFARSAEWNRPWIAWTPIDHEQAPPPVVESLRYAAGVVAMSRHGQKALGEAGITAAYIPHGVNTRLFCPGEPNEARERVYLPRDRFIIGMVAANNFYPSRKCIPQVLAAFAGFKKTCPDALLYLHMVDDESKEGVDIAKVCGTLGLKMGEDVQVADQFQLQLGYSPAAMADLYRSFNVLANPSYGEGFGIPIIEALSCGTPVIATNGTSMRELVEGAGWLVHGEPWWSQQGAWQTLPRVSEIEAAMQMAYHTWESDSYGWQGMQRLARARAETEYDFESVVAPAWDRYLREVVDHVPAGHEHSWSRTGVWIKEQFYVPCLEAGCDAALRKSRNGREAVVQGFSTRVDGLRLILEDDPRGGVAKIICYEIQHSYGLNQLTFEPGDVVIDIGAHVGVVSIYLAKKWPGIQVYAYEPSPENYARLQRNLQANGVENVQAFNLAVTGDGRTLAMSGNPELNSGGMSAFIPTQTSSVQFEVPSVTLKEIIETHGIERCQLLKIDCEGAEYEILQAGEELLDRVEYLSGELHTSTALAEQGQDPKSLLGMLAGHIPADQIRFTTVRLQE